MIKRCVLISAVMLSLTACTAPPQPVIELNPQPVIHASPIGQGKAIAVQVIDARAGGFSNAQIDPQQNVSQIFTQQIDQALNAYGFSTVILPQQQNQPRLIFRILSINYGVANGYFGSNTETTVSAQVNVATPHGSYSQLYSASAYSDNYLTAAKQTPSQQVNMAVNRLLNNLFNDQALWQFLANG